MVTRAAYFVRHQGESKMVGKVFPIPLGDGDIYVCQHIVSKDNQHLVMYDSPSGIEALLFDRLRDEGVPWFIHQYEHANQGLMIPVRRISEAPREVVDGRDRWWPPKDWWEPVTRIKPPWIPLEITLASAS